MASNLEAPRTLEARASNPIAMASNLEAMASNLEAMASNLIAMASKLWNQFGTRTYKFFPKALRRVLPENPLNTDTSTLTLTH